MNSTTVSLIPTSSVNSNLVIVAEEITPEFTPAATGYNELLADCLVHLIEYDECEYSIIRVNWAIGENICLYQKDKKYGDGFVNKLAADLTKKREKPVYEQRLYECMRVFKTFPGNEGMYKIKELAKKFDEDGKTLTWNMLVKHCTRPPAPSEIEEYAEFYKKKLSLCENIITELGKIVEQKDAMSEPVREEIEGSIIGIRDTIENIAVNFADDGEQLNSGKHKSGTDHITASASPVQTSETAILEYITAGWTREQIVTFCKTLMGGKCLSCEVNSEKGIKQQGEYDKKIYSPEQINNTSF